MTTPTDPSTLPQWRGQPVPWVTRWSRENLEHEKYGVKPQPDGSLVATYGNPDAEVRDSFGVLWMREGIKRGGDPEWRRVSTYRQRACMVKRLCQVCGTKITEDPIEWLMPFDGIEPWSTSGSALTIQPPTCAACVPLALDVCPNLSKYGWILVHVRSYEVWGVSGDLPYLNEENRLVRTNGITPYKDPSVPLKQMVARQAVAKLTNFRIADRGGGDAARAT